MSEKFENITIDELAGMMNKSFVHLEKKIDNKVDGLRNEIIPRLDKIEERLEHIEDTMIREDRQRIERLEDKMAQVQVILKTQL